MISPTYTGVQTEDHCEDISGGGKDSSHWSAVFCVNGRCKFPYLAQTLTIRMRKKSNLHRGHSEQGGTGPGSD